MQPKDSALYSSNEPWWLLAVDQGAKWFRHKSQGSTAGSLYHSHRDVHWWEHPSRAAEVCSCWQPAPGPSLCSVQNTDCLWVGVWFVLLANGCVLVDTARITWEVLAETVGTKHLLFCQGRSYRQEKLRFTFVGGRMTVIVPGSYFPKADTDFFCWNSLTTAVLLPLALTQDYRVTAIMKNYPINRLTWRLNEAIQSDSTKLFFFFWSTLTSRHYSEIKKRRIL